MPGCAAGRSRALTPARGDPAVIAGYMGRSEAFDDALASFAMAYAEQTVKDHAALVKAKGGAKAEASPKAAKPARKSRSRRGSRPDIQVRRRRRRETGGRRPPPWRTGDGRSRVRIEPFQSLARRLASHSPSALSLEPSPGLHLATDAFRSTQPVGSRRDALWSCFSTIFLLSTTIALRSEIRNGLFCFQRIRFLIKMLRQMHSYK